MEASDCMPSHRSERQVQRARTGGCRNGLPDGGFTSLKEWVRGTAEDAKEG
jgi:hypothetical protein